MNLDFQELKDMNADGAIYLAVISQLSHTDEIDNNVIEMIFSLQKQRFQKEPRFCFGIFHSFFFHITFFPLMRRWGLGEEVLKKVEKNFYPLALPQTPVETHVRFVPGNILKHKKDKNSTLKMFSIDPR